MSDEYPVECATHGPANDTYVCVHLAAQPRQRWYCDYPSADNAWPDAWCADCEREFQRYGEWNEDNEAGSDIEMLCHYCYEAGIAASLDAVDADMAAAWDAHCAQCMEALQAKQAQLAQAFDLSRHERWDYDLEQGRIVFSSQDVPVVIAEIEAIGSVSTVSDTWLWAWANFSLPASVVGRLPAVRDFGEHSGFPRLTLWKWPAAAVDGWDMSAIAAHVLQADGIYRVPLDKGFLFLALFNTRRVG